MPTRRGWARPQAGDTGAPEPRRAQALPAPRAQAPASRTVSRNLSFKSRVWRLVAASERTDLGWSLTRERPRGLRGRTGSTPRENRTPSQMC